MMRSNDGTNNDDLSLDHDPRWRQAAQRHYEPDRDGDLTTAIVFAIAEAEGVSPSELTSPLLYDSVDVPAIEAAFFGPDTGDVPRQGTGTVTFPYTDYRVSIKNDGWIQVYETNGTDTS